MGAIASLSLNLQTNLSGWTSGLKTASNSVDKFYARVADRIGAAASPVTGAVKSVRALGGSLVDLSRSAVAPLAKVSAGLSEIGSKAAGALAPAAKLAGGLALGFAGIGVAVVGAGVSMASAGLDRIDALSDASQRLGVTTEALSELRYAANLTGSSADDLDGALEKLSANLGDSATKATPTSEALARLGLDAKKLANDGPDAAFKAIVGGFEKIPNASEKASLAMDIFGKGGVKILNTLGAGSGELERLSAEAKKFGVSVSQVDAAKIGVAKDAMDRAGAAIEGIGNSLAIELAPIIEVVANSFTDWFGSAVEGAGGVQSAIGGVVKAVGWVADAGWLAEKALQEAFASVIDGAATVLETLGISGGKALRDAANAFHEDIKRNFAEAPSEKLGKFLDGIKEKAASAAEASAKTARANLGAGTSMETLGSSIAEVTKKLKEQADSFGKSAAEADLYKLAQQGATEAQLADARAQVDRLKGLEDQKAKQEDLKSFAKSYWESTRSNAEKYEAELEKIAAAQKAGLLDGKTAARAVEKAGKEAGVSQTEGSKFAGATELGSSGAYSTIVSALSGKGDGMKDVARSTSLTAQNTAALLVEFRKSNRSIGSTEQGMNI